MPKKCKKDNAIQCYYTYVTKLGIVHIEQKDNKITKIKIEKEEELIKHIQKKETELIKNTYQQIKEYLEGKRKDFQIPLKQQGTKFQQKVWNVLLQIPYGETRSYKQIAQAIGNPKACRAVGMANHNNPYIIVVPCHRVIGQNDKLVGYAGGLDIKQQLLEIEKQG